MATKIVIKAPDGEQHEVILQGTFYSLSQLTIETKKVMTLNAINAINKVEIADIYVKEGLVPAVRKVRNLADCGLKDAKDWVDKHIKPLSLHDYMNLKYVTDNQRRTT